MAVLRNKEQYQQWVTFYESVQNWPEAKANTGFKFPKLVFYGADSVTTTGGVTVGYAATIRERRKELEALGWRVSEIPGKGHGVGLDHRTGGARIPRQGNLNAIRREKPYGRIPIRPADHLPRIFPG
jgi:hypothetical protein